ncbi:hypothetical protein [Phytopseudomonas dryadis]|uniref:Uncharacterized protein n=1 Tax=Phytopseudomonas dryadis TaxID=2487520 RepID=A0A4Q9QVP3_9GAMM|nr:hypothetical protein [Pseudomonas dryadis]TBU86795.1 hypothetical protein DNK44_22100 [Pseudomonas dryadis]
MANFRVQAFARELAAEAIRELIPDDTQLADAELLWPENKAQVMQELQRLADTLLAESLRLESI